MLNNFVLVGRVIKKEELENILKIQIRVPRNYKNSNGEYDEDYLDITADNLLAKNCNEYCEINDIIGVKGSIRKLSDDEELYFII